MGSVFKYIADAALAAHRESEFPCPLCDREVDVYSFSATVDLPGEGPTPFTELCVDCIKSRRLDEVTRWDTEKRILDHLRLAPQPLEKSERRIRQAEICEELRRTPRLPHFVQDDDWPFCCNDLTEYQGEPTRAAAESLDRDGFYWRRGVAEFHDKARDLVPSDRLAVLGGVSAFRCPTCGKAYWTFQCT